MTPLALLASSRLSCAAGTGSGTVTVPAGATVIGFSAIAIAGGSFTVAPGGANQTGVTQPSITVPANSAYTIDNQAVLGQMGPGTVFVFTTVDSYVIWYATNRQG